MRIHGCLPPFSSFQIIAWVLLVLFISIYFVVFVQVLPFGWNLLAYIIVGGGTIISSVAGLIVTTTNSADPNVLKKDPYFSKRATSFVLPKGKKVIDETNFCCLCQVQVKQKSKHCRLCDKCVDTFDHHCKWLNNCIGKQNYTVFLIYVALMFITTLAYCITGGYIFITYFVDRNAITSRLRSHYQNFDPTLLIAIVAVCSVFVFCVFCLVSQLFFFHIKIAFFEHITTYEYILRQRARKEERRQAMAVPGKAVPMRHLERNISARSDGPPSTPNSSRLSLSLNLRRIGSSPRVAPLPMPVDASTPAASTHGFVWTEPAPARAQDHTAKLPVLVSPPSTQAPMTYADAKATLTTTPRGYNLPANAKLEIPAKLPHIESPNLAKLPELDNSITKGVPLPSARTVDDLSDTSTKSIQYITTTMTTTTMTTTTTTTTITPFSSTPTPRRSSLGVHESESHIFTPSPCLTPSPRLAPSPRLPTPPSSTSTSPGHSPIPSPNGSLVFPPPSPPLAPIRIPSSPYFSPSFPSLSFSPPPLPPGSPPNPESSSPSTAPAGKHPLPPIRSSQTISVS